MTRTTGFVAVGIFASLASVARAEPIGAEATAAHAAASPSDAPVDNAALPFGSAASPGGAGLVEVSAFAGVQRFGKQTELGNAWAAEQVPGTAPVFGVRVSWLALPALPAHLQFAVEGELAIATASTGDDAAAGRMSYFAPVFAWRGHALLRWARPHDLEPHLLVGIGGETVASSSPFMSKETDPLYYWGAGLQVPIAQAWHARLDGRHGLMPARDGGVESTFELVFAVGASFGGSPRPLPRPEPAVVAPPPLDNTDRDGDGIPDRLDACPNEAETVNGIADDDGCPEDDPDGDGIVGELDRCPNEAEDFDGFEDTDGCPELDNDQDGVPDARDACPAVAETRNGFDDDDGCPDEVPAAVTKVLAARLVFEANRARVTPAAAKQLAPLLALLQEHPQIRLVITGHPDRRGGEDLAKRRAEAVKWYLVDQGVVEDRLTTATGEQIRARAVTYALDAER